MRHTVKAATPTGTRQPISSPPFASLVLRATLTEPQGVSIPKTVCVGQPTARGYARTVAFHAKRDYCFSSKALLRQRHSSLRVTPGSAAFGIWHGDGPARRRRR